MLSLSRPLIPDRLIQILRSCELEDGSLFPSTELFNEGWMLRLLLDAIQSIKLIPNRLALEQGARWYSEARLSSPFAPRRRADRLAEGLTNADGVLGQFEFRQATRAGLTLKPAANQFVVLEAKMFSNLSSGTKNAPAYNQAVRNLACMAWVLAQARRKPAEFASLGFYVIAPKPERRRPGYTNLENFMDPISIRLAMHQRIAAYEATQREEAPELRRWEQEHFVPLVDQLFAWVAWPFFLGKIAFKKFRQLMRLRGRIWSASISPALQLHRMRLALKLWPDRDLLIGGQFDAR